MRLCWYKDNRSDESVGESYHICQTNVGGRERQMKAFYRIHVHDAA